MKNDYEIRGEITAIYLKRDDGTALETIVDTSDLQRLNEFDGRWYATPSRDKKSYYAKSNKQIATGKWKSTTLHRWLMNATDLYVDHINHDTLDNRRSVNLREVTQQQNCENKTGARVTSKSGIRGVCWHKGQKMWSAQVQARGKAIYLGYFHDIHEAESVVIAARLKHMSHSQEAIIS